MADKTNFAQSLMHMIKGNLGTGILAMPISFKHAGLATATIGLPFICIIATFCVHLLVRSSQHLETKMKWSNLDYAALAKAAFKAGPAWTRRLSGGLSRLVDGILIVSQVGICCVYLVFIVDNVYSILHGSQHHPDKDDSSSTTTTSSPVDHQQHPQEHQHVEIVSKQMLFMSLIPFVLGISYIRTLRRLSLASACANVLQASGIVIIITHLVRNMPEKYNVKLAETSLESVALGFGSAMFAFEGISVVMPVYLRMKRPEQMGGLCGLINLSYTILLCLYAAIGLLGYLCFGDDVHDSITLNLPPDTLGNVVRAIFAASIFLTYPLQFYVPNEIIWGWLSSRIYADNAPAAKLQGNANLEYFFRTILVLFTFMLAILVPKLNLLMDLVGSISGTALSITLPAIIHLVTFWDDVSGSSKALMIVIDFALILVSLLASASGTYASLLAILKPSKSH